jgi:hypothetical protein
VAMQFPKDVKGRKERSNFQRVQKAFYTALKDWENY